MTIKSTLTITLKAENVIVAESTDENLWQAVLQAITNGNVITGENYASNKLKPKEIIDHDDNLAPINNLKKSIITFSKELDLTPEDIIGALSPSDTDPFLHLDAYYWEALKKNNPSRGRSAISSTGLAASALCLWFKHAGIIKNPTAKECAGVLKTINISDNNSGRSIQNTNWLQKRGSGIVINPAQWSHATTLVKAYCKREKFEL